MQSDGEFSHHSTTDDAESRFPGHWLSAGESKCRITKLIQFRPFYPIKGLQRATRLYIVNII